MEAPIRDINTPEHHLWSDVLHARALSLQALNSWDRSSYIRWCIITGWTVLEMIFRKVLNDNEIGHRFKEDVDRAVGNMGLPRINWGEGVWQRILLLKETRKEIIHTKHDQDQLFLETTIANEFVNDLQAGIISIYSYTKQPVPPWIHYSEDRGWDDGDRFGGAHSVVERQGAKMDDPESFIISYTYKGREHPTEVLPPSSDYIKVVEDLINNIRLPITCIKVCQGKKVIFEKHLMIRGGF
jgi:hypothetical protein